MTDVREPILISTVFITLFVTCLPALATQSSGVQDVALNLADGLSEIGNHEQAITEYKRFLCFNADQAMASRVWHRIGLAYRNQEKWHEAIDSMRKSISMTSDDSLRDVGRLSIAIIKLAVGDYSGAEFDLLRVAHFSYYSSLRRKAFFFLGVRYIYSHKWEESRKSFRLHFSNSASNEGSEVDSLLALSPSLSYRSAHAAKWLSTFLPGSGQIYCGDWRNGISALAVNSLTSYLLIDAVVERRFADLIMNYVMFFYRYYQGNRHNAERAAILRNENLSSTHARKIMGSLQQ